MRTIFVLTGALLAAAVLATTAVAGETGGDVWLRYAPIGDGAARDAYRRSASRIVAPSASPTARAAATELQRGLRGLLATDVPLAGAVTAGGAVVIGTPGASLIVAGLDWTVPLAGLGAEGFLIRQAKVAGHAVTVIASNGESGVLYGVFHFLRLIQTRQPIDRLDIAERPRLALRLLNHWDNLDGTHRARLRRARRSGTGTTCRPASTRASRTTRGPTRRSASTAPCSTTSTRVPSRCLPAYLLRSGRRARTSFGPTASASISRRTSPPRGSSAASPRPTRSTRRSPRWWREKADEIYRLIPDFGGFLVKANSEGQPGPQDYGRTHADGANMLADALAPHGGIVMWRAFVYSADVDPDRVKRAYLEFVPLDGHFRDNVIVQVKNGPLDFQPREPFSPLFGGMPRTPLMAELQITQEYLGQSTHLVYLAPMWKEFLDADTYAAAGLDRREGDRRLAPRPPPTAIAGVANTGRDDNWCGHDFGQANWYAFGRLAWDPALSAEGSRTSGSDDVERTPRLPPPRSGT